MALPRSPAEAMEKYRMFFDMLYWGTQALFAQSSELFAYMKYVVGVVLQEECCQKQQPAVCLHGQDDVDLVDARRPSSKPSEG